ncbi:MAG: glycosyltransferase family 61 protein [Alphaproteobacteria bacterium]|nr:glycosyltransferase family 61 protein [Alphaproteobacteria bacterium]
MRLKIDFDRLICRSVLDRADRRLLRVPEAGLDAGIDLPLATCPDVLYLPDVLDHGQSLCVADGGVVPLESILDPWTLDFVRAKRQSNPALGFLYRGDFEVAHAEQTVSILGNVFSRNFAHWTEELLKVVVLEAFDAGCHYVLSGLPGFAREFLGLLGIAPQRIVSPETPVVYDAALFTPAVSHENICSHPQVAQLLRHRLLAPLEGRRSAHAPRLWLERGEMVRNGGVTLNREDVHALVRCHGFEVLDMATLPLDQQLLAMRDAEAIAGPHGAQFAHVMFMPPRSKVVECFAPGHVNPSVLQICRLLGHSYHQVVGRSHKIGTQTRVRDLMVDCEHLALVLDDLFGGLSPRVPPVRGAT